MPAHGASESHLMRSLEAIEVRRVASAVRSRLFGTTIAPVCMGRFELRHTLGAGGYGRVYAALDPSLERLVALKVVPCASEQEREDALAEAKILAALRHPNVVTIHEVGEYDDGIYFAMPLLEGTTLREWCDAEKPGLRALERHFGMAARGLAAVHAAGLVHGDIKPDNFIRTDAGDVVLIDFGLATRAATDGAERLAGTRGYLAPERLAGRPSSPKSDQFSFCVTLYEAASGRPAKFVHGEFSGDLGRTGAVESRRIRRVLARGLQSDPEQRFAAVEEIGDALDRHVGRFAALGVAFIAVAAGGTAAWLMKAEPCRAAGDSVALRRVETLVEEAALDAQIEPDLVSFLRDQGRTIAQAKVRRCTATHIDRSQSADLMALRLACLERREQMLLAVSTAVVSQGRGVASETEAMIELLGDVESCEARQQPEGPAASADQLARRRRLVEMVDGASVSLAAGRLDLASSQLREVDTRLEAEPDVAVAPRVATVKGRLAFASGDVKRGRALLLEASRLAYAQADHAHAFEAWLALAELAPDGGDTPAKAQEWLQLADAARQRLDPGNTLAQARLRLVRGVNASHRGDYAAAVAELETALELWTRVWGADNPTGAKIETRLANALVQVGQTDRPTQLYRAALERRTRILGPAHPATADAKFNLGSHLLENLDQREEAAALLQSAAQDLSERYGEQSPEIADVFLGLAQAHLSLGDVSSAEQAAKRAADVMLTHFGPDHHELLTAHMAQGAIAQLQGRGEDASAFYASGQALGERVLGADHPLLLLLSVNQIQLELELQPDRSTALEAVAALGRLLTKLEDQLGRDSEFLGLVHAAIGSAQMGVGEMHLAMRAFSEALRIMPASYRWDRADVYTRLAACLPPGAERTSAIEAADALWTDLGEAGQSRRHLIEQHIRELTDASAKTARP